MRLDRMLGITMELLSKRRVSATELAARFEVSNRTIYRDIELINQAGIPIASFAGTDGGFELMNGYFLSRQHFSVEDLSVIYNLLRGMDGAMGGRSASLMNKLSSLQPALLKGRNAYKIIFDMSTSESEKAIVHPLFQAIGENRIVSFSYINAAGTATKRRVEPMALYWERGAWYLEGYCLMRGAKRIFRISRLAGLEVSDERFAPRESSSYTDEADYPGIEVHLRFDRSAQPRVSEQFPDECSPHGDSVDVRKVFYSMEYAVSVVLSYGSKVTVLSPEELKRCVLKTIEDIREKYK